MAEIIHGFSEFERNLNELDRVVRQELLTEAAHAGADIVLEDAARRAPRDQGDLASGMTKRVSRQSDANEVSVEVGPDKKQFYGFFQERGTKHAPAQPFLKPALETNRERIAAAMKDVLLRGIERLSSRWR